MELESILVFRAGDERLGVPVSMLLGVSEARITSLPLTRPEHLGIMLIYGSVYPIFDPVYLAGLGAMSGPAQLVVFLEAAGWGLGLACDRVEGTHPVRAQRRDSRGRTIVSAGGGPVLVPNLEDDVTRLLAPG